MGKGGSAGNAAARDPARQPTFFCEVEDATDVALLAAWCQQRGVEVWADCRMPNHGHWIVVPCAWRRTVSGAAGTSARPSFASAQTRSEEGITTIVAYDVP
jgi:REP element-mobilizing transposase RayT